MTISDLTFENGIDNTGDGGGAILNNGATLNVVRCTFLNNKTSTSGGAIANKFSGTVYISNSMFTGNEGNFGGAIGNFSGMSILQIVRSQTTVLRPVMEELSQMTAQSTLQIVRSLRILLPVKAGLLQVMGQLPF